MKRNMVVTDTINDQFTSSLLTNNIGLSLIYSECENQPDLEQRISSN